MSTHSFTSTTFLSCVSIIISAVVTGLATVNFGILSIWVNGLAGILTLLYHLTLLACAWSCATLTFPRSVKSENPILPDDVKMPTIPSPIYSPPPYASEKLTPNRRFSSKSIMIPRTSQDLILNLNNIPSGPFYSITSLIAIVILTIVTVIGFGMTVELTTHGAGFLLPAERAKGMTFPWNLKVQKAQCTFLGVLLVLDLVMLAHCAKGRSAISRLEDERREEIEYGLASPDSTDHPAFQDRKNQV